MHFVGLDDIHAVATAATRSAGNAHMRVRCELRVAMPVVFLYWVLIDVPHPLCGRAHRGSDHRVVGLERMQAGRSCAYQKCRTSSVD